MPDVNLIIKATSKTYLQANKALTNLCLHNRDLVNPVWVDRITDPPTTYEQTEGGIDGVANKAWKVDEVNTGNNFANMQQDVVIAANTDTCVVSIFIREEAAHEHYPEAGISLFGGTTLDYSVQLNPYNGDAAVRQDLPEGRYSVKKIGKFYRFILSLQNDGTNTLFRFQIKPAMGSIEGGLGVYRSGAHGATIFDSPAMFLNTTIEDVIDSPPIETTTAAASIPALDYVFPSTNINPADAHIKLKIEYAGGVTDVLSIGNLTLKCEYTGDVTVNLVLNGGGGEVILPISAGSNSIEVILTATTMELKLNGTSASGAYTPPVAGAITLSENTWLLQSEIN